GRTSTRSSAETCVSCSPGSPFTNTLMCRRSTPRSSRIQPFAAGCARSSSARRSPTLAPATACSARSPTSCLSGPRRTTTGMVRILGDDMASDLVIRLRGVVKRFGPITAVDGLDLDLTAGTCLGLLGPNGAGKSTTMRMLTALAIPDAGELEVLGFEVPRDSKQARALCGVVPQLDNLDVELTARQNLAVFARLYRV